MGQGARKQDAAKKRGTGSRRGRQKGPAGQDNREKTRDREKFYSERGKETGKIEEDRR